MIRLDSTVRSLEVILAGAVTTNQLPVTASWADSSSAGYLGGANVTNTNSGTAVTAAAAPTSSGVVRDIDFLNIYNADTVSATATVRINDNGTFYIQCKVALAVGDTLKYTHAKSWEVLNSSGQTKTGSGISSIGASTDNALVRWDGTGGTNIQNSGWTLTDADVLTAAGNVSLGANYISRAGTAAGFSLDASNNATLSAGATVVGVTTLRTAGGSGSVLIGPSAVASGYTVDLRDSIGGLLHLVGTGTTTALIQAELTSNSFVGTAVNILANVAAGTGWTAININADQDGTPATIFKVDGAGNTTLSGTLTVSGATITTGSATSLSLATSGGTIATFNNDGTVAIGVVPKTWDTYKVLSVGGAGANIYGSSGDDVSIGSNIYRNAGFKRANGTTVVTNLAIYNGTFNFQTAAAGAADSAVTFLDQVKITHTAGATNSLTLTGSNGGNPTIGVSGGSLAISSAVVMASTLTLTATASPTGNGAGAVGQIAWDTAYLYVCTATNDWRRIALVDF